MAIGLLEAELLHGILACEKVCRNNPKCCEHGETAVVELLVAELLSTTQAATVAPAQNNLHLSTPQTKPYRIPDREPDLPGVPDPKPEPLNCSSSLYWPRPSGSPKSPAWTTKFGDPWNGVHLRVMRLGVTKIFPKPFNP